MAVTSGKNTVPHTTGSTEDRRRGEELYLKIRKPWWQNMLPSISGLGLVSGLTPIRKQTLPTTQPAPTT